MLTDTFRVFRTTDLPDGSRAWVVIAVYAQDKNSFVREVHIARASGLGGLVLSTEFTEIGGADDETEQREFEEAQRWAWNRVANQWLKNPEFACDDFKLTNVDAADVLRAQYDPNFPQTFGRIVNATESATLREWLTGFQ